MRLEPDQVNNKKLKENTGHFMDSKVWDKHILEIFESGPSITE